MMRCAARAARTAFCYDAPGEGVYAPALLKAQTFSAVASQIDLAPTLLGLLNVDYSSTFFGRNLLRSDRAPGRALCPVYRGLERCGPPGNHPHLEVCQG